MLHVEAHLGAPSVPKTSNLADSILDMPFLLQPASIEDVHKIVFVFQAAFRDDPIISQLMCDAEPSTKYNYDIANFSKYIRDGHLTGSRFVKVIRAATL